MDPQIPRPTFTAAESRLFELQVHSTPTGASSDDPPPSTEQLTADHAQRQRRLGRACDACSKRKVKCGDVVPCRNCIQLGVECTFARPAKRRGPANRVAEDLKRAKFEVNDLNSAPGGGEPSGASPATAGAPQAPPMISNAYPPLDSIAPNATIMRMVYDFFTYVYPIFPFPHEHLVMERLRKREDAQNQSFAALVSSLLAVLASVFPRVASLALRELEQNGNVIAPDVFVGRCMLVCQESRSPFGSGRDVDDAATAFMLGIVNFTRKQHRLVDSFMREALNVVLYLGVEEQGTLADGHPADHVTKELCRRIFWSIYNFSPDIIKTRPVADVIPFPLSTDDYYIYIDRLETKPQGQLSTLDGFVLKTQVCKTRYPLLKFEPFSAEERQWDSITGLVSSAAAQALKEMERILASGHPEFTSLPNPRVFEAEDPAHSQQARMHVRWEIQKIALRISLITTQVYLAEQLAKGLKDDAKNDFRDLMKKILNDIKELSSALNIASLEPVVKLIEPPFMFAMQRVKLLSQLAGQDLGAEQITAQGEDVIKAALQTIR